MGVDRSPEDRRPAPRRAPACADLAELLVATGASTGAVVNGHVYCMAASLQLALRVLSTLIIIQEARGDGPFDVAHSVYVDRGNVWLSQVDLLNSR